MKKKKINNTSLIGYNGLFSYSEIGTCSLYEFIYTYRNDYDSLLPSIVSQETINALNMMKKIKEEVSNEFNYKYEEKYL